MIGALALKLLGDRAPGWLTGPLRWLVDAAVILTIAIVAYLLIFNSGQRHGAAKVERKVEQAHTAAVAEARHDERTMQGTADAIGHATTTANDLRGALVAAKTKEIHDAIDHASPTAPGIPAAVFPDERVSDALDALVTDANRAAGAAGSAGRAEPH